MNGQLVVYDPEVQVNTSSWVNLFFRTYERYTPYIKVHARNVIKKIDKNHKEFGSTINHYEAWLDTNKEQKILNALEDLKERDKKLTFRIAALKDKHRKHVEDSGHKYTGVSEPPFKNE